MDSLHTATEVPNAALAPLLTHWLDVTPRTSDDQTCTIQSLQVEARVCGLYAQVSETLVVANPNRRPISASVSILMPDRAVICGYAIDIDGQLIDGVVVPAEQARIAFETERRRLADPGIVEAARGNVYRTQIYPIPPHGTRTLRLRFVTPLLVHEGHSATLELPMPVEHLDRRTIKLQVQIIDAPKPQLSGLGNAMLGETDCFWTAESDETDLTPEGPVRVQMPSLPETIILIERDCKGTLWFSVSQEDTPYEMDTPELTQLAVLWDASGSRAAQDHAPELELLRTWAKTGSIERYTLVTFADRVLETLEFAQVDELLEHLRAIRYDGGTNLADLADAVAALPQATTNIEQGGGCVLFTDGLDTLSLDPATMPDDCDVLAVVSGAERDSEALRQACQGLAIDVALAPRDTSELARLLIHTNPAHTLDIESEGIADILDAGSVGTGRRTVIGRLIREPATIFFTDEEYEYEYELDGEGEPDGETLACAWAARRVNQLSVRSNENARELLKLGRRFGVVSPVTSLIVLENLNQWLRYEIEPPRTWEPMHQQWVAARRGAMRHGSRVSQRDVSMSELRSAWAELKRWWERDFSEVTPWERTTTHDRYIGLIEEEEGLGDLADSVPESIERLFSGGEPRLARSARSARPHACIADVEDARPLPCSMPASAPESLRESSAPASAPEAPAAAPAAAPASRVRVRPWSPDTTYLKALDAAPTGDGDAAYEVYLGLRAQNATSPSFFLDCAGWFLTHGHTDTGVRVLTNLAEMRIEDAGLLRVMGWRLREANKLELALVTLRRVQRLRSEDAQSYRDLTLVLEELARQAFAAGDKTTAASYVCEATSLHRKVATTPWRRRAMALALFAVEEYNVLRAWAAQNLPDGQAANLPLLDTELDGVLDCDLRVTLAWDADDTDVDIHVTEPTGEEAYYAHRHTHGGGRVSEDITDGYGPELYEVRRALEGTYDIRAHYFASHQQTVFGPATCTLTIFTDWGRPNQTKQLTTVRLDRAKEMIPVGVASYSAAAREEEPEEETTHETPITAGMDVAEVLDALGQPNEALARDGENYGRLVYRLSGNRQLLVEVNEAGIVTRVFEHMPWGEDMILSQ